MAAEYVDRIPYSVGLVELEDQIRMIGLLRVPEQQLYIGMPLRARFPDAGAPRPILEWVPAASA
jgi:uncharacterized OB-fold protein